MSNVELFQKLLIITKQLTLKEKGLMDLLGVEFDYSSKFISESINELLELGREILKIEQYSWQEDEYYRYTIDFTLEDLTLEETISKIEELINE